MKNSADYQSFQKRRTSIVGVWDDHDYGVNDGGASDLMYSAAVQVGVLGKCIAYWQAGLVNEHRGLSSFERILGGILF